MRKARFPLAVLAALTVPLLSSLAFAQGEGQPVPPAGAAPGVTPPASGTPATPATGDAPAEEPAAPAATEPASEPPPAPARESACTGGVDDDKDGAADCADTDCAEDAACKPATPPPPPVAASVPAADPEADKGANEKPFETTLAIEGLMGVTTRLGSADSGYETSDRSGLQYGLGLFFAPDRKFAFGLSYLYSGLGTEEFDPTVLDTSGRLDRRLHTAFASARAYPLRTDSIGLWAGLGLGLTWQTAHASGSYATGEFPRATETYAVDVGPQAGLALGASVGMDLDLARDVAMLASANFTNHRLSSDPLDGSEQPSIPGIGATSQLDFRLAFQYRFDVSGMRSPGHVEVQTSSR